MSDTIDTLPKEPKKTLVLMMGLPRSGKSTLAKRFSKDKGWPIINRDSIRLAVHGQRYQALAEPMVKAIALIMVRSLFNTGHTTVLVDETSLKRVTRDFWRSDDWTTQVFEMHTPIEVCLERARANKDVRIAPVIESMAEYAEYLEDDEIRFQEDYSETPDIS